MSNILEIKPQPETHIQELVRKHDGLPKDLAAKLIDKRRAELIAEKQKLEREFGSKEARYKARLQTLNEVKATMDFLIKCEISGLSAKVSPSVGGPLRAHKFLSFLSGDGEGGMLDDPSVKRMFDYIQGAEKFSFYSAVCGENFDYLSDFGKDLFSAGLVRFPYEKVYFEVGVRVGGQDMVCAMWGGEDDPGIWFYVSPNYGRSWAPGGAINRNTGDIDTRLESGQKTAGITKSLGDIFYACMALLASTSVTVSDKVVSNAANQKRLEAGKVPIFSHRIVTINQSVVRRGAGVGSHAPPRLHWRRGHIRRYRSGIERWIAPTLVGCADRGVVTHDYRVKAPPSSTG